jgi:hypothetical protein
VTDTLRGVRTSVVLLALCSPLAACQREPPPKHDQPPTNAEVPVGVSPNATRTRIALPAPTGKPPIKTTGEFDKPMMDKIGEPSFEGWEKVPHGGHNGHVQVRHVTKDHPKIMAEITIDPCKDACTPIELAKWQDNAKQDELKTTLLGSALIAAPDTTWVLGQTEVNNVPMIYVYGLGQAFSNGGSYADFYALYYNDGANQLRVIAHYDDDPTRTQQLMAQLAPKDMLEKIAKAFMDAYGQIW